MSSVYNVEDSTLRNTVEGRRSEIHRGGNLKSCTILLTSLVRLHSAAPNQTQFQLCVRRVCKFGLRRASYQCKCYYKVVYLKIFTLLFVLVYTFINFSCTTHYKSYQHFWNEWEHCQAVGQNTAGHEFNPSNSCGYYMQRPG